jgi:hypothetical protein
MNDLVTNVGGGISAAAYYFKAAVSLAVSNPWFLGLTVMLLLSSGKSLKLGKALSVKG